MTLLKFLIFSDLLTTSGQSFNSVADKDILLNKKKLIQSGSSSRILTKRKEKPGLWSDILGLLVICMFLGSLEPNVHPQKR